MIALLALAAVVDQPALTPTFIRTAAPADLATRILGLAGADTIDARVTDESMARDDRFTLEFAEQPHVLARGICAAPVRYTTLWRTNLRQWDDPPFYRTTNVNTAMRYAPLRHGAADEDCTGRIRIFGSKWSASPFFDLSVRHGGDPVKADPAHVRFVIATIDVAIGAARQGRSIRCRDDRQGAPEANHCVSVVAEFASLSTGYPDNIALAPCPTAATRWCVSANRLFTGGVTNSIAATIEIFTGTPVSAPGEMRVPTDVRTEIALITPPSHWP